MKNTYKIDYLVTKRLQDLDPTSDYRYLDWLKNQYIKGDIDLNNHIRLQRLKSVLSFHSRESVSKLINLSTLNSVHDLFEKTECLYNNEEHLTRLEIELLNKIEKMKNTYKITWVEDRERKSILVIASSSLKALLKWVESYPEKVFCSIIKTPTVNARK